MAASKKIYVIDCGGQYAHLIASRVRKHEALSVIRGLRYGLCASPKGQQPLVPYLFGDTTNRGGDPAALA